jgi:hypothetical protein
MCPGTASRFHQPNVRIELRNTGRLLSRACGPVHHLWQLAGGGALYPDCVGVAIIPGAPVCSTRDDAHVPGTRVREVLVTTQAALVNTSGRFVVDLRYAQPQHDVWGDATRPGLLPPDPSFNNAKTEAVWDNYQITDSTVGATQRRTIGHAVCRTDNAQRLGPAISSIPLCSIPAQGGTNMTLRTLVR